MKKTILLCAALILSVAFAAPATFAQKQKAKVPKPSKSAAATAAPGSNGYTIEGNYDFFPEGTKIYLKVSDGSKFTKIDSTLMGAGQNFRFTGKAGDTPVYAALANEQFDLLYFVLENADYRIVCSNHGTPEVTTTSAQTASLERYKAESRKVRSAAGALALADSTIRLNGNFVGSYVFEKANYYMDFFKRRELLGFFPESFSTPQVEAIRRDVAGKEDTIRRAQQPKVRPEGGFLIHGEIEGGGDGLVFMRPIEGIRIPNEYVDFTPMKDGKFEFAGKLDIPEYFFFITGDYGPSISLFVENSEITAKLQKETYEGKEMTVVHVEGSASDDESRAMFKQKWAPETAWKGREYEVMKEYIAKDPKNPVALYFMGEYTSNRSPLRVAQMKELTGMFDPSLHSTRMWKGIQASIAELERIPDIGEKLKDFASADTTGKQIYLSSVVYRNKYTLLDFWASWCGPCRGQSPQLVAAYEKYHAKGFEIFGVSVDGSGEAWKKAIVDDGYTWINVSDLKGWECPPREMYNVRGVPTNYLIGPDGRIVARNLSGWELELKLKELLGE